MKLHPRTRQGITLVEVMIGAAMLGVAGGIIYAVLNSGLVLFTKNSSINLAHQQARTAVMEMTRDIHAAVSAPQLVDASRNVVSGSGPAAGISFQMMAGSPFKVSANAAANESQIAVVTNSYTPVAGQRLIVPAIPIELDITAVSKSNLVSTLTLSGTLGTPVTVSSGANNFNVVCFVTDRVYYVVSSGNLCCYRGTSTQPIILGPNISNPTPFSIPTTISGAPNNRFVSAINLSTADPTYSNRGYKSANMFLNAQVPIMARLTTYQ